ncbi:MAG: HD-GYP domain-containing protein [Planctomycetes bacterium]|nr:HD-GYP domain-containing protein [Planctomycetota bacterium]
MKIDKPDWWDGKGDIEGFESRFKRLTAELPVYAEESSIDDPRVISSADLVDLADRALYSAKHQGRDQVSCSYELDEMADVTATIQSDEIDWLRRRLTALSVRAKDVYMQSVAALLQTLDEKDPYTARHSINVAYYAQQLAEQMGCSQATIKSVCNAALLHDIGKVGVPDRILNKREPLTDVERMVLGQVPLIGTRIVDHLRILESEQQIIRHQREHFDGSGLPSGLKGTKIPIGARILLVADAFDAMTTDRAYRRRRAIDEVVEELHRLAGKQFDPRAVTAHRQCLNTFRSDWENRIDETVRELQVPSGGRLANEFSQSTAQARR